VAGNLDQEARIVSTDFVFCLAVAFVVGCNLYFGRRIDSERLAMQWGMDGRPTWYAPKAVALWGTVAFMLAVRLFIWASATYAPEKTHGVEIAVAVFPLVAAAAHFVVLRKALSANRSR